MYQANILKCTASYLTPLIFGIIDCAEHRFLEQLGIKVLLKVLEIPGQTILLSKWFSLNTD